jgi:CspA family cold shock protein
MVPTVSLDMQHPATPDSHMEEQLPTSVVVMNEVRDENTTTSTHTGQCKWFNNSYGYGFLTVVDGPNKGADIFVHWEGIKPLNSMYKTLKKGEYCIFDVVESEKGKQAVNVRGICGGPLLCDHIQVRKGQPPPPPPPYMTNHGGANAMPTEWTTVNHGGHGRGGRGGGGVNMARPGAKRTRYGRVPSHDNMAEN